MTLLSSRIGVTALLVLGVAVGCGEQRADSAVVDGVWEVTDYGTILEVRGGEMRTYQVTAVSCVEGDSGSGSDGRFVTAEGDVYTVRAGDRSDRARLHLDGSPGDLSLRQTTIPARCTAAASVFDVVWQTFEENYPFFAAKGMDWNEVRGRFEARARAAESSGDDAALFATLRDMVAPLDDAHVVLQAGDIGRFGGHRPGTVMPGPALDRQVLDLVQRRDLGGTEFAEFGKGRIVFATLPGRPDYGYLRVSGFGGYTDDNTFAANSVELERALD
ncbi:protease, partial [Streptomyces roseolus]